jgi:hypothetical protein
VHGRVVNTGVAVVALVGAMLSEAGPAAAHSRAPTIALDVRLRLVEPLDVPGVRAEVIDGDRELRLQVDPRVQLVVRGLLGEPVLRFDAAGVWVNGGSPTAEADKLLPAHRPRSGWIRLTSRHSRNWHDHRLAPPPTLVASGTAPFSLPVTVDGRADVIKGWFKRVPRPSPWPWLAGALLAMTALVAVGRAAPARRDELAAGLACLAAAAALAASMGYATGNPITRLGAWIQIGCTALLTLMVPAALLMQNRGARAFVAALVGAIVAAISLASLGIFRHGVVISSLPSSLARLLTAIAVVGGLAAAGFGVFANDEEPERVRAGVWAR